MTSVPSQALTITVTGLKRHFRFIVDVILPIEEVIYVTRRGRVRQAVVTREILDCMVAGARAFDPMDAQGKRSQKVPVALANYLALFECLGNVSRELSEQSLPQYPQDDCPLTDEQHRAIDQAVGSKFRNAKVVEPLFNHEVSSDVKPPSRD